MTTAHGKILLVDDDPKLRLALRSTLQMLGFDMTNWLRVLEIFVSHCSLPAASCGVSRGKSPHDEKPRFLKLFPLSGNPVASYGESQD